MLLSLLNFKGLLKRTITSDMFNGIYTCDGIDRIEKTSINYGKRQMFVLKEIDENGEKKHDEKVIFFNQVGNDVYFETDFVRAKILKMDGFNLVLVNESGEHLLLFNF